MFGEHLFQPNPEDGDTQIWDGTKYVPGSSSTAEKYIAIDCSNFHAANPDTDQVHLVNGRYMSTDADGISYYAPLNLPNGARITSCIIYGSISDETWTLDYQNFDGVNGGTVANANLNSADAANHVVDNNSQAYFIQTSSLDTGDDIYGGYITYT